MTPTIIRAGLKGTAEPIPNASGALFAELAGDGDVLRSGNGTDQAESNSVVLKSTVVTGDSGSFVETGTLFIGKGDSVTFVTKMPGTMAEGHDHAEGLTVGSIIWQIVEGQGSFKEATGYITSNFYIKPDGEITDNVTAVIFHNAR